MGEAECKKNIFCPLPAAPSVPFWQFGFCQKGRGEGDNKAKKIVSARKPRKELYLEGDWRVSKSDLWESVATAQFRPFLPPYHARGGTLIWELPS